MNQLSERLEQMTPMQRAVYALKETQARLDALKRQREEPIAIVGMSCRFPGRVHDPASFWQLLCDGVDAIRETPSDRWDVDAFYDPDPMAPGKMNTRWGGFLDHIDEFDNHFFGISDREAARIDPQHRMLLEVAWEALEDAGIPPSTLRGSRAGVYIGISVSEYGALLAGDICTTDAHVGTGTSHCIAANRISFTFDFSGPSVALDTACSSSLVATHLACQSIRNGEASMALAGGVNLILSPLSTINLTKSGFSAVDGRVRAFDASATGYVRGEGAGIVVLKPLSAALENSDPIYAVIRGSAVNQNGCNIGISAPSRVAQENVLRQAYSEAKVPPVRIRFVETQGTGTPIGDAIEATALGSVLGKDRPAGERCLIGSVKTNIGHLEAAAGVASLMKAALSLKHQRIPPNLHFETPNPDIDFDELRLKVSQRVENWPESEHARSAGVSAFGFGGSNAHVVLEEPPQSNRLSRRGEDGGRHRHLLLLSARTERALEALAQRYVDYLKDDALAWSDVCYTAAVRRDHHDCRLAISAASHQEALDLLAAFLANDVRPGVFSGRRPHGRGPKIAFVYHGLAEHWASFCRKIDETPKVFRESVNEVDVELERIAGWSLKSVLAETSRWKDPAYAVPCVVTLELALSNWWHLLGITPDAVLGQRVGELSAACVAGILGVDEALGEAVALGRGASASEATKYRSAKLPFISAQDGRPHDGPDLSSAHWRSCLVESNELAAGIDRLRHRKVEVCMEVGPEALVTQLEERIGTEDKSIAIASTLGLSGVAHDTLQNALGILYAAGCLLRWNHLSPSDGRCVRLPTYPWQRQRLWVDCENPLMKPLISHVDIPRESQLAESGDGHRTTEAHTEEVSVRSRPELNTPNVAPRTPLEKAMVQEWREVLKIEGIGIHDNFFELGGDSLQVTILLNRLQEHLGEVVPLFILFRVQTIEELASYLRRHYAKDVRRLYPNEPISEEDEPEPEPSKSVRRSDVMLARQLAGSLLEGVTFPPPAKRKNPRAVFVLSPPRSGSTLFRVMMAGHERLFAPPELELLGFSTMADRRGSHEKAGTMWSRGVVRTLMEIHSCNAEEARDLMLRAEADKTTVQDFYRHMQEAIGERILVDKTPSYSTLLPVIERAESLFDDPLYIHLLRHPCGMIRSFVDYKLHETYYRQQIDSRFEVPFSPHQIGELVWVISHENILNFLERVPADRQHRLQFEELVRQPEQIMRELCEFLELDYRPAMIDPYGDPRGKMLDGVVDEDRMQGDQKFMLKHKSIDPAVADTWKADTTSEFLGQPARELAAKLGYDDLDPSLEEDRDSQLGSPGVEPTSIPALGRDNEATQLLAGVNQLSDDDVATLLERLSAGSETTDD